MVWPGMNHVLGMSYSASRSTRRFAPTSPNSPRAIRLGDFDRRGPIHTEMASKSNVRQTETPVFLVTVMDSARYVEPVVQAEPVAHGLVTCRLRRRRQPHTVVPLRANEGLAVEGEQQRPVLGRRRVAAGGVPHASFHGDDGSRR